MSEEITGGKSVNYTINSPNFVQQGWQCPICHKILAPYMTYCPFHDEWNDRWDKWSITSATGKVGGTE